MILGCGDVMLGSVDSYGHLIVSKLDASGEGIFFFFFFYLNHSGFPCVDN